MGDETTTDAHGRARAAADSVRALFGRRLLGIPTTHLARVDYPVGRAIRGPWHYWWQAHYLDALVDEVLRERAAASARRAEVAELLARRLLRSIRLRNVLRFPNHYYDDMAWLLLAAYRFGQLGSAPVPIAGAAVRALVPRIRSGLTEDLGGGLYWNDSHDFKNVPASAPAAIFWARSGSPLRAARVVDWLYERLHDGDSGLFLDGIRVGPDGALTTVRDLYTYNQGTVLGALVELGDPLSLRRAGALVEAIGAGLTESSQPDVLRGHGDGDGGLFTGIAVRYLALAAVHHGLAPEARERAATLVQATADALWAGHRDEPPRRRRSRAAGEGMLVFSPEPARPAEVTQPLGAPVELSTQLQAWLILEAAATLTPPERRGDDA